MKITIQREEEIEVQLPVFKKWYNWHYAILDEDTAIVVYEEHINVSTIKEVLAQDKKESTKEEFVEAFNKALPLQLEQLETIKNKLS